MKNILLISLKKKEIKNQSINLYKIFNKILIIIILLVLYNKSFNKINYLNEINHNYLKFQKDLNLSLNDKLSKKIRIGFYTYSLKNGGLQRLTSLIINFISKIKIYDIYLFTKIPKQNNEYIIPDNIPRTVIEKPKINNLIKQAFKNKIDILIYNFFNSSEINLLNNIKNLTVIFYIHQSFLYWIYYNYTSFKSLYKAYQKSKYVISLVPFENDYLFKKWGISSILMNNFISYDFNSVIPSDLSSKIILMIGRAEDKLKRFELGIKAMKYIGQEIPECLMKIISEILHYSRLKNLIKEINKKYQNIKFVGYSSMPEFYYKNASLHIFPSISEAFPLVLCETKIYGIPNILIGLDYLSISNGGTIIIYDDEPESIAKEAIKILKNETLRKNLGKEARNSMKYFQNELILKKWNKIILSIYHGNNSYQKLRVEDKKIPDNISIKIINNQINLFKKRNITKKNITFNDILNFTFMENLM